MIIKINPNNISKSPLIIYSLIKVLESRNSENFFEFYSPYIYKGKFILSLGQSHTVSMELIGKFADEYGDFYVGFYNDSENTVINILDFESFLKKESDIDEDIIHDILLFKYAGFIAGNEQELRNFFNLIETLFPEDKKYFELELEKISSDIVMGTVKKGLNDKREQILDDIELLVDGNKTVMTRVRSLL